MKEMLENLFHTLRSVSIPPVVFEFHAACANQRWDVAEDILSHPIAPRTLNAVIPETDMDMFLTSLWFQAPLEIIKILVEGKNVTIQTRSGEKNFLNILLMHPDRQEAWDIAQYLIEKVRPSFEEVQAIPEPFNLSGQQLKEKMAFFAEKVNLSSLSTPTSSKPKSRL